jgi:hypothetical protein
MHGLVWCREVNVSIYDRAVDEAELCQALLKFFATTAVASVFDAFIEFPRDGVERPA